MGKNTKFLKDGNGVKPLKVKEGGGVSLQVKVEVGTKDGSLSDK